MARWRRRRSTRGTRSDDDTGASSPTSSSSQTTNLSLRIPFRRRLPGRPPRPSPPQQPSGDHTWVCQRQNSDEHVWIAEGPPLETFENEAAGFVYSLLEGNAGIPRTSAQWGFDLFVMGKQKQAAVPTIVVWCPDSSFRKEAVRVLRSNLAKEPLGRFSQYRVESTNISPHSTYEPDRWASSCPDDYLETGLFASAEKSSQAIIYGETGQPTLGRRLLAREVDETSFGAFHGHQSATGGYFMTVGSGTYQITAGHLVDFQSPPRAGSKSRIRCLWDDDDVTPPPADVHHITSGGSMTSASDDSDWEDDVECWDSSTSSAETTSRAQDKCIDSEDTESNLLVPDWGEQTLQPVGYFRYSSLDVGPGGLDYGLVRVEQADKIGPSNPHTDSQGPGHSAVPMKLRNILICTHSGRRVKGILLPAPSRVHEPGAASVLKRYAIRLSDDLGPGDSGAAVFDEESGIAYGHIVTGCAASRTAFMISAADVVCDIQSKTSLAVRVLALHEHITTPRSPFEHERIPGSSTTGQKIDSLGNLPIGNQLQYQRVALQLKGTEGDWTTISAIIDTTAKYAKYSFISSKAAMALGLQLHPILPNDKLGLNMTALGVLRSSSFVTVQTRSMAYAVPDQEIILLVSNDMKPDDTGIDLVLGQSHYRRLKEKPSRTHVFAIESDSEDTDHCSRAIPEWRNVYGVNSIEELSQSIEIPLLHHKIQPSDYDIQPSGYDIQHSGYDIQHSYYNFQVPQVSQNEAYRSVPNHRTILCGLSDFAQGIGISNFEIMCTESNQKSPVVGTDEVARRLARQSEVEDTNFESAHGTEHSD